MSGRCNWCYKINDRLFLCEECRDPKNLYCSIKCQKMDWGEHKNIYHNEKVNNKRMNFYDDNLPALKKINVKTHLYHDNLPALKKIDYNKSIPTSFGSKKRKIPQFIKMDDIICEEEEKKTTNDSKYQSVNTKRKIPKFIKIDDVTCEQSKPVHNTNSKLKKQLSGTTKVKDILKKRTMSPTAPDIFYPTTNFDNSVTELSNWKHNKRYNDLYTTESIDYGPWNPIDEYISIVDILGKPTKIKNDIINSNDNYVVWKNLTGDWSVFEEIRLEDKMKKHKPTSIYDMKARVDFVSAKLKIPFEINKEMASALMKLDPVSINLDIPDQKIKINGCFLGNVIAVARSVVLLLKKTGLSYILKRYSTDIFSTVKISKSGHDRIHMEYTSTFYKFLKDIKIN